MQLNPRHVPHAETHPRPHRCGLTVMPSPSPFAIAQVVFLPCTALVPHGVKHWSERRRVLTVQAAPISLRVRTEAIVALDSDPSGAVHAIASAVSHGVHELGGGVSSSVSRLLSGVTKPSAQLGAPSAYDQSCRGGASPIGERSHAQLESTHTPSSVLEHVHAPREPIGTNTSPQAHSGVHVHSAHGLSASLATREPMTTSTHGVRTVSWSSSVSSGARSAREE